MFTVEALKQITITIGLNDEYKMYKEKGKELH